MSFTQHRPSGFSRKADADGVRGEILPGVGAAGFNPESESVICETAIVDRRALKAKNMKMHNMPRVMLALVCLQFTSAAVVCQQPESREESVKPGINDNYSLYGIVP